MPPSVARFAKGLETFGRVYNGFEVSGFENIPRDRAALLVLYHGLMPLDGWYFSAWYYHQTGRMVRPLGDRFLFKTPGLAWLLRQGGAVPGEPQVALDLLSAGHLVLVSPGGVREALSGRQRHYQVIWGQRMGFARLAIEAGVAVLPAFTENVEELYRAPFCDRPFFQRIYERTRLPIVPVVGLGALPFPVKLRMHIGAPIPATDFTTPEALRDRTREALSQMMAAYRAPGPRIPRGIAARIFRRKRAHADAPRSE